MSEGASILLFCLCGAFVIFVPSLAFGLYFFTKQKNQIAKLQQSLTQQIKQKEALQQENKSLQSTLQETGALEVLGVKKKLAELEVQKTQVVITLADLGKREREITDQIANAQNKLNSIISQIAQSEKSVTSNANKVRQLQTLYKSMQYSIDRYFAIENVPNDPAIADLGLQVEEILLSTTIKLKLHLMDVRELRKLYGQVEKNIHQLFEKYKDRYTTKANIAIYRLMVIGLDAELQNVLYNLSFSKLDQAINDIKTITAKYRVIATDGNQGIATTVNKFIGEVEYLFMEAIKIEYEYYIQKERIREEQKAIREQMRQEAAEQKRLEEERKKIEQEESKYKAEILNAQELLKATTDEVKIAQLEARIAKVQEQLNGVEEKKDDIINLQNGRAGYIYIISNLGSFGENVFKIGMTRRLNPQERIDELGDASVPFWFDVHSLIFSNSAPELEYKLHQQLNSQRINKVNLRKEFFRASIDQIEALVYSLEPSAEFNRTMLAEQYYQSMAVSVVPETVSIIEESEDISEEE
jgi:hypothetical protein